MVKNFDFEGWSEKTEQWICLLSVSNDSSWEDAGGDHAIARWQLSTPASTTFRKFRFRQTVAAGGDWFFAVCGIELYGHLYGSSVGSVHTATTMTLAQLCSLLSCAPLLLTVEESAGKEGEADLDLQRRLVEMLLRHCVSTLRYALDCGALEDTLGAMERGSVAALLPVAIDGLHRCKVCDFDGSETLCSLVQAGEECVSAFTAVEAKLEGLLHLPDIRPVYGNSRAVCGLAAAAVFCRSCPVVGVARLSEDPTRTVKLDGADIVLVHGDAHGYSVHGREERQRAEGLAQVE